MATEIEAVEDAEEGAEQPARGRKGLIIMIVATLALCGGGFGAWKAFAGKADPKKETAKVELLPPRYINLDPPFVVNFEADSAVRFLQVTVGVMTRDAATEQIIKNNDPRLRNDLLMILGNQSYSTVSTIEGKEALRTRCLESVRAIVKEMQGEAPKVEALYFTSFVMQ
jgi:flagellar protein FliL